MRMPKNSTLQEVKWIKVAEHKNRDLFKVIINTGRGNAYLEVVDTQRGQLVLHYFSVVHNEHKSLAFSKPRIDRGEMLPFNIFLAEHGPPIIITTIWKVVPKLKPATVPA